MKKKVISMLALGSIILTACSSSSKQEVAEDSIQGTEVQFMEWPVVKEEGAVKKTVSLNNLYVTTNKEWAIGVQDGYYKVDLEENVAESDRIDYQSVLENVDFT